MTGPNVPTTKTTRPKTARPARKTAKPVRKTGGPLRKWPRLRWTAWRVGWVLLLTAFWSSGKLRLGTIWDLAVAAIVVAVFSVLLARVKRVYQAFKELGRAAWQEGQRGAARQLARAIMHLKN
jgi:hypothetical protein